MEIRGVNRTPSYNNSYNSTTQANTTSANTQTSASQQNNTKSSDMQTSAPQSPPASTIGWLFNNFTSFIFARRFDSTTLRAQCKENVEEVVQAAAENTLISEPFSNHHWTEARSQFHDYAWQDTPFEGDNRHWSGKSSKDYSHLWY
ncbi:MAG: hypothetical protein ON057_000227 [Glomeribacter sp. 1016415]|nr:hypothetical protein [Glomeribacter sp. 1016415]